MRTRHEKLTYNQEYYRKNRAAILAHHHAAYWADPEAYREKTRRYNERNLEKVRASRRFHEGLRKDERLEYARDRRRKGLLRSQRLAKAVFDEHGGQCAICRRTLVLRKTGPKDLWACID